MTDEIQRLEAELHDAIGKWNDAKRRLRAALEQKALADYAALGIAPGLKVRAVSSRGSQVCFFAGVRGKFPILAPMKKDGTMSNAKNYIPFDRLEPFP